MIGIDSTHHIIPPTIDQDWFETILGRLKVYVDQTAPNSIYVYDLVDQRTLICSEHSVPTLLGYGAHQADALGKLGLAALIHPADVPSVSTYFHQLNTLKMGEIITLAYRMKRVDGTWCPLRSQDTSLISAIDGFPLKIIGLVADISAPPPSKIDLIRMSHMSLQNVA
jgi:hypothetical protein